MSSKDQKRSRKFYSADPGVAKERTLSRAVMTEGGKTIWLSGGVSSDPKLDFDSQVRDVFKSLDKTIKGVGGNGLSDMVTMTAYTYVGYGERFLEIRKEFFKEDFAASTLVGVAGFNRPGIMFELTATAVVDEK